MVSARTTTHILPTRKEVQVGTVRGGSGGGRVLREEELRPLEGTHVLQHLLTAATWGWGLCFQTVYRYKGSQKSGLTK